MKNYWIGSATSNSIDEDDEDDFYICWGYQFVSSEILNPPSGVFLCDRRDNLVLQHGNLHKWATTGVIYLRGKAIQLFYKGKDGTTFQELIASEVKVVSVDLNHITGEISFLWNGTPCDHNYTVSYEYTPEQ